MATKRNSPESIFPLLCPSRLSSKFALQTKKSTQLIMYLPYVGANANILMFSSIHLPAINLLGAFMKTKFSSRFGFDAFVLGQTGPSACGLGDSRAVGSDSMPIDGRHSDCSLDCRGIDCRRSRSPHRVLCMAKTFYTPYCNYSYPPVTG